MKLRHQRSRSERGAAYVEMAFATTVFMMLLTATFDFGRMHFTRSSLQHAVSQSTRFATTGNTVSDPNGEDGSKLSREDSIKYLIRSISGLADINDNDVEMYTLDSSGNKVLGPGGPGDVVVVRVRYGVNPITPGLAAVFPEGRYEFFCTTTFRNEEFTASVSDDAFIDGTSARAFA